MDQDRKGKGKERKLAPEELWEYACRALGRSGLSEAELRRKLLRRTARPEDAEYVLLRLKDASFLNDTQFAASYAAGRLEWQKWGKQRVAQELLRREVKPEEVRETVEGLYEGVDETALAEAFILKKYSGVEGGPRFREPKEAVAAFAKLRRAGFSAAVSARVLRRFSSLNEVLEALADSGEETE